MATDFFQDENIAPEDAPASSHPPQRFWELNAVWDDLLPHPPIDSTPALKQLGLLPFPRGKFPLIGFLATVYEHITHPETDAPTDEEEAAP